jgi:ABC-type branched-subunit amino acid transport system substrate-binding protein
VATGSSIKIGEIVDETGNGGANKPYIDAFDSAVKAANAAGGIHGHSIDLVVCDSQANNNAAAACGQEMAQKKVIGVMADDSGEDTWIPYLQNAGIPVFSGGGLPLEYTSPVAFITNDFSDLVSTGYVALLAQAGCKSVASVLALVGSTSTAIQYFTKAEQTAAQRFNVAWKGNVTVPSGAPDLAPYIDEAANKGAQCIEETAVGVQAISALKELAPLAAENKFDKTVICTACLSIPGTAAAETPLINALGNHIVLLGASEPPTDTSNPVVAKWVHDQTAYNSSKTPDLEAVSATNWANLQLMIQAANATYPNVSAKNELNYLNQLTNWWPGVFPSESFNKPIPNPFGPRVFGAWAAGFHWTPTGQNLPRITPFISLLTGENSQNPQPAAYNASNYE